ncbi:MAG TPA: DUF4097 family beta strand repeat-containing protein [Gemmataceae bacterium]|nr:DUF4097 family beta strand repeat-containing protein [Gemmataceae bacterium]
MRTARLLLLVGLVSFATLNLLGCGITNYRYAAQQAISQSFTTEPKPEIIVETFNGSIEVLAGIDNKVKATVTKHTRGRTKEAAQDDLENIEVSITREDNTIHVVAINTDHDSWHSRGATVELEIPAGAVLDLNTSNGQIEVTGASGAVSAETSNGKIHIDGTNGPLTLHTSNGGIAVKGGAGRLELKTGNGAIDVDSNHVVVDAQTSNGSIRFDGDLAAGENSFHTSNGKISIHLPSEASFHVDAQTSNGRITSDFPLKERRTKEDHRLRGEVGDHPDTSIKLTTSNSSIEIREK